MNFRDIARFNDARLEALRSQLRSIIREIQANGRLCNSFPDAAVPLRDGGQIDGNIVQSLREVVRSVSDEDAIALENERLRALLREFEEKNRTLLNEVSTLRNREQALSTYKSKYNEMKKKFKMLSIVLHGGANHAVILSIQDFLRSSMSAFKYFWFLRRWAREVRIKIIESNCFDEIWYVENYPDVLSSHIKPIDHFVRFGILELRLPNRDFTWNIEDGSSDGLEELMSHFDCSDVAT